MDGPGLPGRSLEEAACFECQDHLMHGGRRDSKVLLHFGLGWRTSMDFVVVINESQILTLFVGVGLLHRHRSNKPNSNQLSSQRKPYRGRAIFKAWRSRARILRNADSAPSTATLSRSRRERHFDEFVPSRSCSIDSGPYFRPVLPYDWPDIGAEETKANFRPPSFCWQRMF